MAKVVGGEDGEDEGVKSENNEGELVMRMNVMRVKMVRLEVVRVKAVRVKGGEGEGR
jgi:hypothetical protein